MTVSLCVSSRFIEFPPHMEVEFYINFVLGVAVASKEL